MTYWTSRSLSAPFAARAALRAARVARSTSAGSVAFLMPAMLSLEYARMQPPPESLRSRGTALVTATGRPHRAPRHFTATRLRTLAKLHARLTREAESAPYIIDNNNKLEVETWLYRAAMSTQHALEAMEQGELIHLAQSAPLTTGS